MAAKVPCRFAALADMQEPGHSAADRLVEWAFWTLGALCLLNLNGLVRMWIGVERAFSPVILICCVVALGGLARIRPREALGGPGLLILGALASYAGIGFIVSLANGAAADPDALGFLRQHLNSLLVIPAAAVGGRVLWRRFGSERALLGTTVLLTGSCALIMASPLFVDMLQWPPRDSAFRYFGAFPDPNEAAFVAALSVAAALALLRRERSRPFAYAALLVALAALVSTFSRTALLSLPGIVAVTWWHSHGPERKRIATATTVILAVAVGVLSPGAQTLLDDRRAERLNSVTEILAAPVVGDLDMEERSALWRMGLEEAMKSPWLGSGLGTQHSLDGAWFNAEGYLLGVHNQYLILLGEAGVLPALLFVAFLVAALRAGARANGAYWPLAVVSGWALVVAVFSISFHTVLTQRACNFILGLSCAAMASFPPGGVSDESSSAGSRSLQPAASGRGNTHGSG